MDQLQKQVARAHRRLVLEQFCRRLVWCVFAALVVACSAILLPKLMALEVQADLWTAAWLIGSVLAGVVAAGLWTWLHHRQPLEAAIEIDRRFALKERVSSTLALGSEDLETEAGRALASDAVRRVKGINVGERFGVSLGRRAWLPLIPAALAIALIFVPNKSLDSRAQAKTTPPAERKQIKKSTEVLRRKLTERKKQAEKEGLKDATDLLNKVEEGARELSDREDANRKKALIKLNDLAKQLEDRRQSLGGADKVRQQLSKLDDMKQGPADELAKSLQQGNFDKAKQELDKLRQQIENSDLDEKQKQQLGEQLGQMEQKLNDLANAHEEAQQQLQKQIDKMQGDKAKQGLSPEQEKQLQQLQQQMKDLKQQSPQMNKLRDMAQKLGKACENCQQGGDPQAAADALKQLSQSLDDMQLDAKEMQMLDEAVDAIAQAKQSMGCDKCGGAGCKQCNGLRQQQNNGQGSGIGTGRGRTYGPEDQLDGSAYDSRVSSKVGPGEAEVVGTVDGPNRRGAVRAEISREEKSIRDAQTDPLADQPLPRGRRDHAREYFDALREGS